MELGKNTHSFEVVVDPYNPSHLQVALNGLSRDRRVTERMQVELAKVKHLKVSTEEDSGGEVVIDINNIDYFSPAHTSAVFGYILRESIKDMYPNTQVGILDTHHRVPDKATDFPIRREA